MNYKDMSTKELKKLLIDVKNTTILTPGSSWEHTWDTIFAIENELKNRNALEYAYYSK